MATIKLGAIITDVRGAIGGTIFSRNANASYAKNFTKPTNPNTQRQQAVRGLFAQVAQAWRDLTDEQRESWVVSAALSEFSYTNKVGEQSFYTGSQLFMKLNNQLLQLNPTATPFVTAPEPLSLTDIFQLSVNASQASGIGLSVNNAVDLPAGQEVLVYATGQVSNGVYRPKGSMFKLLGAYPTIGFGAIDGALLTADYVARFGAPAEDDVTWFKVETYAPATGQTIPGQMVKVVVTA